MEQHWKGWGWSQPHLATGVQTAPDDEVHEPPSQREASQQLPLHSPEIVYPVRDSKHPLPAKEWMRTCVERPLLPPASLYVQIVYAKCRMLKRAKFRESVIDLVIIFDSEHAVVFMLNVHHTTINTHKSICCTISFDWDYVIFKDRDVWMIKSQTRMLKFHKDYYLHMLNFKFWCRRNSDVYKGELIALYMRLDSDWHVLVDNNLNPISKCMEQSPNQEFPRL